MIRSVVPALVAASLAIVACNKVPYTNRKQFNPVPGVLMNSMGKQSYAETLQGSYVIWQGRV